MPIECQIEIKAVDQEALLYFTSGPESGLLPVAIHSRDRIVGYQKMRLLTPETAWHLTAVKSNRASYENHVLRQLGHTHLKRLHWINLNQNEIHFKTLKNDSVFK